MQLKLKLNATKLTCAWIGRTRRYGSDTEGRRHLAVSEVEEKPIAWRLLIKTPRVD